LALLFTFVLATISASYFWANGITNHVGEVSAHSNS